MATSFPTSPSAHRVVESIRQCTKLHLDVHVMIENRERFVTDFLKAGANSVLVHYEAYAAIWMAPSN